MNGFSNTGDHFPCRGFSQSPRDRILLDTGQQWRQDGTEQIEDMHQDEIWTPNPILEELAREGRPK